MQELSVSWFINFLDSLMMLFSHRQFNSSNYAVKSKRISIGVQDSNTLNLEDTEENLYDDLEDSSGNEGKRPAMKEHSEEESRLQCSTTT